LSLSLSHLQRGAPPPAAVTPRCRRHHVLPPQSCAATSAIPGTCDATPSTAAANRLAVLASPTWMALGRCLCSPEDAPGGNSSSSSSSTSSCSSPSYSVLQHLTDFRRVPMSI
ncbi:hypothetical protein Taro_053909, partial [Colocasia esculenta]|nr:hypothetical protein [Colocasia esculenta]